MDLSLRTLQANENLFQLMERFFQILIPFSNNWLALGLCKPHHLSRSFVLNSTRSSISLFIVKKIIPIDTNICHQLILIRKWLITR